MLMTLHRMAGPHNTSGGDQKTMCHAKKNAYHFQEALKSMQQFALLL